MILHVFLVEHVLKASTLAHVSTAVYTIFIAHDHIVRPSMCIRGYASTCLQSSWLFIRNTVFCNPQRTQFNLFKNFMMD